MVHDKVADDVEVAENLGIKNVFLSHAQRCQPKLMPHYPPQHHVCGNDEAHEFSWVEDVDGNEVSVA